MRFAIHFAMASALFFGPGCGNAARDSRLVRSEASVPHAIASAPGLEVSETPLIVRPAAGLEIGMIAWAAVARDGLTYLFHRGEKGDPILVVDDAGTIVRSWGEGLFVFPHSIRIDPEGNVWAVDAMTSVVRKFTPTGTTLLELAVEGKPRSCENSCGTTDVAFAPNGNVFVADGYLNARILEYTPDGRRVNEWGRAGTAPGELQQPHSIVIDSDGILYEADRLNGRIQRFSLAGEYLGGWTGFGKTHALDIADRALWLVTQLPQFDNGTGPGWIVKVDPRSGKALGQVAFSGAHGMAVLPNGEFLAVPGPERRRPTWFRNVPQPVR